MARLPRHDIIGMLAEYQIDNGSEAEHLFQDPDLVCNLYAHILFRMDSPAKQMIQETMNVIECPEAYTPMDMITPESDFLELVLGLFLNFFLHRKTKLNIVKPFGNDFSLSEEQQLAAEARIYQMNAKIAEDDESKEELPLLAVVNSKTIECHQTISGFNTNQNFSEASTKKLKDEAKESNEKDCKKMSKNFGRMQASHLRNQLCLLFSLPLLLMLQPQPVYSHYFPSTPSATQQAEWKSARATYYATADPRDIVGGACGYGDLEKNGYGKATAALSTVLFEKGQICGACFELRCVEDLRWCIPGTSIIVTATNFCAPNYGFDANGGGKCNPPNPHFVLPIEAFEKIAIWKASNMPVQYRRIRCRKEGGVRFTVSGVGIFMSVLISNVAGGGDVTAVKIKGSRTGWLPMGRNWGQNWHINADLKNQPLSFELTSSDGITLTSYTVAPKNWDFGQSFEGKQFDS